jgi:uncharacterized membrane protein
MIEHPLVLLSFMLLVVFASRLIENRFEFVKMITSAGLCTILGIALANLGILPHTSSVHEGIYEFGIPFAIVLVILSSRLRDLRRAGKRFVICYGLAVAGSFAGSLVAGLLFYRWIGPETWKLSGMFTGTFIGGGMNFAAIGQGLDVSPGLFAGATVADNLSSVPWLLTQLFLAARLARFYPKAPVIAKDDGGSQEDPRKYWTSTSINITELALLMSLPLGAMWVSSYLSEWFPNVPEVIWITSLALIVAQFPFTRKLRGAAVLAYFSLHLFFVVIGTNSDVTEVIKAGPTLVIYMVLIMVIHGVVVYGGGWLLRMDLPSLTIASQAAIGGPDSALAIAMAMKWGDFVTPGIIVGIFGYAVGNYFGIACANILRAIL